MAYLLHPVASSLTFKYPDLILAIDQLNAQILVL